MARRAPYTKTKFLIDLILFLITGGAWLIIIILKEIYMQSGK